MAAVLTGAGDFSRTTSLPANLTACTFMAYVKVTTIPGSGYSRFLNLTGASGPPLEDLGASLDNSANDIVIWNGSALTTGGGSVTTDTWIHVAMRGDGDVLVGGSVVANGSSPSSVAAANAYLGGRGGDYLTGKIAYVRIYDANLSDAEIATEMASTTAVRTSDLLLDHSFLSSAGSGWSTNGSGISFDSDDPLAASVTTQQEGYRFRADDGSESGATWLAAQDTNITRAADTPTRLRVLVNATGDPASAAYRLEYRVNGGSWAAVPTPAVPTPGSQTFTTAGSSNWAVPADVYAVDVRCWGGGGAGGQRTTNGGGGGGGGGAFAETLNVSVTPASSVPYTVGAAGTTGNPGTHGGDTSFNTSTVVAQGGRTVAQNTATGGTGGLASASTGTTKRDGGSGAAGSGTSYGGGGGSSAGTSAAGNTATNATGASAPTGGGAGGAGKSSPQGNGTAGSAPGGGGGGGLRTSSGTRTGGAGAAGRIELSWTTDPTPAPVELVASSNIAASAATSTTAQLSAPSGKTTGDFLAGLISDDTNPLPSLNLGADDYTELEWCVIANSAGGIVDTDVIDFRVTINGTPLDTYTVTPTWTIGSGGTNVSATPATSTPVVSTPTLVPGQRDLTATPATASATVNTPTLAPGLAAVVATPATSTPVVNTPQVNPVVPATVVGTSPTVNTPTLVPGLKNVAATPATSSPVVNTPTLVPGLATVIATPATSTPTVNTPTVSSVGAPQTVTPTPVSSAPTVNTPTLVPGVRTVTATPATSTPAVNTPTLLPGLRIVTATPATSAPVVNTPTLVRGTATVTPTPVSSAVAVNTPGLVPGSVTVIATPAVGSGTVLTPDIITVPTLYIMPGPVISGATINDPILIPGPVGGTGVSVDFDRRPSQWEKSAWVQRRQAGGKRRGDFVEPLWLQRRKSK